jgi:hypothetical protein
MGEPPDEAEVLAAGQVLVDGGVLAGEPDRVADLVGGGDDVVPQDAGLTGVRAEDRGQDPDGGRLAGAVGPEQAEHGSRRHGEVDAVKGGNVPEPLDETGRDNRGLPGARGAPGKESHASSIGQLLGRAK